ncbi:unnamed protein product [Nezara viridula]|uniref:Uncharacterized protein n=1 Tax=Nezara viridula TaxID=85310 RepID=A0A9P0HME6_NEZVI|nr:unnamed protein product [Nezara viridula]
MIFRFREYFRKAICDWDCCKKKQSTMKLERGETPPIRRFSHSYSRSGGTADEMSGSAGRKGGHHLIVSFKSQKNNNIGNSHSQLIS